MRKRSIVILMTVMLSMTGCRIADNAESLVGGTNATANVEATSKEEPVASLEAAAEQAEDMVYTFPKLTLKNVREVVRTDDGNQELLYYEVDYVAVDEEKYPELAEGLEKWVRQNQSTMEGLKEEFTNEVKEQAEEQAEDNAVDMMNNLTYSISQHIGQVRSDAKILSLEAIYSDYRGGAYGSNGLTGVTFDVETGKELELSDIMSDQEQFERIALDYILESVEKNYNDGLFSEYKKTIEMGISNPNWAMTDYGLRIIYGEDEIAPHAAGIIQVNIPYSAIEDCMKPEYVPAEATPAIFSVGQYDDYKLNLNGTEQTVTFYQTFGGDRYCLTKAVLVLDGTELTLFESDELGDFYNASCLYLRNAEGVSYFILELEGIDEYRTMILFKEENGELIETDSLDGFIETGTMHATAFDCNMTIYVFGTYTAQKTYTINADGKFTTYDTRYRYVNPLDTASAIILTAKQDIAVMMDGEESTLKKGTEIYPIGADEKNFYFQMLSGEEGYITYDDTTYVVQTINGIEVTELFDGIVYAG